MLDGFPVKEWRSSGDRVEVAVQFDYREAARFALLKWEEFMALPSHERSATVAQYRTRHRIDAALAEKARRRASSK